jgi:hypothetical protein
MASRKKLFSILLPATLFFILFYLLIRLYQGSENNAEHAGEGGADARKADQEMTISDSLQ